MNPLVQLFRKEHPEFAGISDEELEAKLSGASVPASPDPLPSAMRTTAAAGVNEKKGSGAYDTPSTASDSSYGDFVRSAGQTFQDSALSLGEGLRSIPIAGDLYKKYGDIVANVFGMPDPGIQEEPDIASRIASERSALRTIAPPPPPGAATTAGKVFAHGAEAASTLPVSEALAVPAASGFMLNAGRALLAGGREAAIAAATSAVQEGDINSDVGASAAFSGAIPILGAAAGGAGNVVSHHLANTLLPTGSEATLAGGEAARGLQDSGVTASGAKSLMLKMKEYARKTGSELESFVTSHPKGSKPIIDRHKLIDALHDDIVYYMNHEGATSGLQGMDTGGEKKAIVKKLMDLKNTISQGSRFISPREALKVRKQIDEMTSFGKEAQKTTASVALNETRQRLRTVLNEELDAVIPESAKLRGKAYDAMLAFEGAQKLFNSPSLGQESFLARRALPLAVSAAGGMGMGYVAGGGNPISALGGLAAGAAMGMPGAATPLIQALKNNPESTKLAEILARVFGIMPGVTGSDEEVQGGPPQ